MGAAEKWCWMDFSGLCKKGIVLQHVSRNELSG